MAGALADTLQSVELADGVEIHLRVAGPAARSTAWLLDFLIRIACYILLGIAFAVATVWVGQIGAGVLMLCLFFMEWFYNVVFEIGPKGATPGQRSMGLKVASVSGGPVRLPQSLIRNLLRVVDFMPFGYLFGLLCCLFTKRFQRLGDLVADTVVIYAEPGQQQPTALKVNADPLAPPVPLSRAEQAAVLQFVERAPQWSDARKIELSDVLQPLTQAQGLAGLTKLCSIGVWLRNHGGR